LATVPVVVTQVAPTVRLIAAVQLSLAGAVAGQVSNTPGEPNNATLLIVLPVAALDAAQLAAWNFAYKTEAEALAFCQAINSEAFLAEDGRIGAPMEDLLFPTE
jgi:hypothetical protein